MPKRAKREPVPIQTLTVDCLCGGDEMVCSGRETWKGFRKFFCPTCHSTLWASPKGFEEADKVNKIMER
jgi:hypothetical protein